MSALLLLQLHKRNRRCLRRKSRDVASGPANGGGGGKKKGDLSAAREEGLFFHCYEGDGEVRKKTTDSMQGSKKAAAELVEEKEVHPICRRSVAGKKKRCSR